MKTLRKLLRAGREAVERSQAEVANMTNVSSRTIRRMEVGDGEVTFDTLGAVRDYLETLGLRFIEPTSGSDWSLAFSSELAPLPEMAREKRRVFYPAPGAVLRAARALLDASQEEIANSADIAHTTIRRLEHSDPNVSPELAYRLETTFKARGVEIRRPHAELGWQIHLVQSNAEIKKQ